MIRNRYGKRRRKEEIVYRNRTLLQNQNYYLNRRNCLNSLFLCSAPKYGRTNGFFGKGLTPPPPNPTPDQKKRGPSLPPAAAAAAAAAAAVPLVPAPPWNEVKKSMSNYANSTLLSSSSLLPPTAAASFPLPPAVKECERGSYPPSSRQMPRLKKSRDLLTRFFFVST